ncbi:DUF445 domain-containing protein [Faecalibacter rhinopitheci]|uniref:DUF445 domain-containing protein n=1 Tax=Faecalibacter rhinopitheci TaxID=2779678 RepID=A0A8J7FQT0_9FLAO|nr:DUF445 domain-containing protein [Faecalibacter rhinopitheci]MBF0597834.1 DUF445 domain-containing protein [Faecalibacter rhinopitheci]MBQ0147418.1 DUF445 domain-containing protein [Candidatus Onthonaster equi]
MTELEKKQSLNKHKTIATGLFVLMAVVYGGMVFLATKSDASWIKYVEAFSEAAMVGALADWFAVTALFKYPLGLKIPHTNLIERSKNSIGESLGFFVTNNFLTPSTIRPYIEKLDVVKFVSDWLNKKSNQEILQEELIAFIQKILKDLDDKEVVGFMTLKGDEILKQFDLQELAGTTIEYVIEKEKHNEVLDLVLPKAKEYIQESNFLIEGKLNEKHPFISFFAGKKISKGVIDGVVSFIEEIEQDKEHPIRKNIQESILNAADKIKTDSTWQIKLNEMRSEFITPERLEEYASDLWQALKTNLTESFAQEDSTLQKYAQKNIQKLSHNLNENQEMIQKINGWIRHFLYRMILRNVNEVETLISNTVGDWEGKDLSEKLELEVGKDLQYIRINGTLVGGLVGLLIYSITQLLLY